MVKHTRHTSALRASGFTLLEVMLVLALMGLFAGFVVVNMQQHDPADQLAKEARRLQVIMNMAADAAILNQQQLGVRVAEDNSLHFLYLDGEQRWQKLQGDKIFDTLELSEPFALELQLDGLPWNEDGDLFTQLLADETLSVSDEKVQIGDPQNEPIPPPQIMLFASGEVTPFSIVLKYEPEFGEQPPTYFRINGIDDTPLQLEGPLDIL